VVHIIYFFLLIKKKVWVVLSKRILYQRLKKNNWEVDELMLLAMSSIWTNSGVLEKETSVLSRIKALKMQQFQWM